MPGKLLFRLECKGYPLPAYTPGLWYDRDRVVLDIDNNPVKKWENIPLTLASNADPWLLENIRREDRRITLKDLRARMPHQQTTKKGVLKPLGTLSSLGMQLTRFRMAAACPAWNDREGSDSIRDYIKGLLSPESLAANSTEELDGLSQWQQAESKKPNKGQYLKRAGDRALSSQERKKREETDARRLNNAAPAKRKASTRACSRARPTATASPPLSSHHESQPAILTVQVSGRKRNCPEAVDAEDGESSPSPKRRNIESGSGIANPLSQLPGTGHPDSPSVSHNPKVVESPPLTQQSDDASWAIQDPISPTNAPPPNPDLTVNAPLERGIRHLSPPAVPRKRNFAAALSEDAEYLPALKRQSMQGVVGSRDGPNQSFRSRALRKLVPRLRRVFPISNRKPDEFAGKKITEDGAIGDVDFRYICPATCREIELVADALFFTRLDFYRRMRVEAPDTPEDECYAIQQQRIQNAIRDLRFGDGEPPQLLGLNNTWTGGFENWHGLQKPSDSRSNVFWTYSK